MARNGFRRKLYVYFFIFSISALIGFALASPSRAEDQGEEKTATVVSNWNEGDNKELTVKIGRQRSENGRMINEDITYDVAIKVIDETRDGYTIEWVYKNITYSGNNPFVKRLYKTSEGLKIVYTTDRDGVFLGLVNWEDVQAHLYLALDQLENEFPENQGIKVLISQFKAIYSSRESIESTLRDIQIYHSPYGGEYTLGEWTSTETSLPDYLGGYPFPAVFKTGMTELDLVKNRCKIVASQTIDASRAAGVIKNFLRTAAGQSGGKPPLEGSGLPVVSVNDFFEYDVELSGGWVSKAYYKRENQTGPVKGGNTYEITLK